MYRAFINLILLGITRLIDKIRSPDELGSLILSDVIITGKIVSNGDIILFGSVHGSVECRILYIGEEAVFDKDQSKCDIYKYIH